MQRQRPYARAAILGLALLAAAWASPAWADQCVECHTRPERLVPAVRELAAAAAKLPGSSELTAGEG